VAAADLQKRLVICAIAVAVVGLVGALLIYFTAGDPTDTDDNVQILIVDGKAYRIPLSDTKMYRHELQRFGGNAAVLFDDLNRWFASLWHGRSLAVTTACITAFVSVALLLLARQMPPDAPPGQLGHEGDSG